MHPILAYRGRLGPYLAAWIPLGGLLAGLLRIAGAPWGEAVAISLPMAVVYAFVCLAAWYPCRAASPRNTPFVRMIATQTAAALVSAMVWLFMVDTWVSLLEQIPAFVGTADRFPRMVPVLLAVAVVLYALAAALHYLLMAFEEARTAERNALELELHAREAELRSLRAQVDPHFLFNALNAISSLIGSDPGVARTMCVMLADFLRESLRVGSATTIPLGDELALTEKYLAVEKVRFGRRLQVEEEVGVEASSCGVPPLLLQPLVENAVRHGVARLMDGGVIRIAARRAGDRLRVTVENPVSRQAPDAASDGVGLANVRGRLAAAYGEDASVVAGHEGDTFRVELAWPARPVQTVSR
jgi:two-component system sensor histidine kinase AlgZ